jgi:ribonuclease HII
MAPPPIMPSLAREAAAWSGGALLLGVDEVGRGPLAGPVVAAAAVFPPATHPLAGVRDSKALSPRQRQALLPGILASALVVAVGAASAREIDRLNIRAATALAMGRAVRRALARLDCPSVEILIDGLPMADCGFPHEALVAGDAHCYSIAAAAIVAKEVRDRLMRRLAARHPGYGWDTNAGYGSAGHLSAIAALGPTRHHRRSFAPVSQLVLDG